MKVKIEQSPATNPNPILSVEKDGTVLYSNEAGESLLHEWGVEIGEKLPSTFGDLVQRVISLNSPEKLEVKVGNRVYLIVFDPVLNEECVNISGFEICDQNEFEEKLQESERRYHLLFENMLDGFAYCKLLYDDFGHPVDFIYLDTNRAFEQLTGLKKVNGKRATEVFPGIKESHPELLEIYNRVASTGKPEKFEIEFKPLGIWLSISVYSTEKEHFIAVFDNVTESKRAERALQESEEKYRIVANNTSDWEFWLDLNGHFLYTSPSCERVTGYAAREFMDNPDLLQEIIYPDDRQAFLQHRHDMPSSRHGDIEFRIVTKNGEIRWIHHLCQSLYDGEGCYAGSRGSNRDITERKRAEEALLESEQHYRLLYETMLQGVVYQDANGKIISMNPAAEKILGKIPAEFLGSSSVGEEYLTIRENGSPFPGLEHPAMVSLRTGRKVQNVVMGVYNPREKRYHWININAVPIFRAGEDKPFQVYTLFDDITERKQAEEMLAFERAQLLSIFDGIDDAVYVTDPYTYEVLYANKAMKEKFGGELVGGICYRKFQERDSPCDFCTNPIILKERGKPYHWEYYNPTVDRYFMIMDRIIKWPDGRDVRFEIAKDITDRKRTEETLRESEEKYRNLIETTNEGVWIFNSVSETTYVNEKMTKMLGYSREEMVGSFIWDYADEEDKGVFQVKLANRKQGIDEVYELKLMRKEGSYVWLLVSAKAFFDTDGKFAGSLGMFTDITERKHAEEALKKAHDSLEAKVKQRTQELEKAYNSLKVSEEKYRNIIETANEGIAIIDSKCIITYANKRLWDMLGYSTEESINKSAYDLVEDVAAFKKKQEERSKGVNDNYELKAVRKDGSKLWVLANVKSLFNEKGEYKGSLGMFTDITERKGAEEKLRESEEKYRNIVETANEGIGVLDNEFKLTYVNKKLEEMIGYSTEELIGKSMWLFLSEESKPIVSLIFERGLQDFENPKLKYIRKDGSYFWAQANAKPIFDNDGKFMSIITMLTDITKQKEAEEYLEKIEIVRKKEIHHRIKNNLQVISSLLDLQATKFRNRKNIKESEVLDAFRESQNRVVSMALIHEELYRGGEIDTLDFSEYIRELADNLCLTYRLGDADIRLNLDLEENTFFDMDTAVPLGMIVNELVSNSFKYAFTGRSKGEIRIELHRDKDGENRSGDYKSINFTLTVSDNGIGMPENLDIKDLDSLGLQMVTSLVDQLDGELELKRNNGTEFTMRFSVVDKDNPTQVDLK